MPLLKRLVCLLLLAVCLLAQMPIGFGIGDSALSIGLLNMFDWYAATPSGCSAGANEYCVGSGGPAGDTMYWSAWANDGTIYGTLNDFSFSGSSGNLMLAKLSGFSWTTTTASKITAVNYMTSYGTGSAATDVPAGWHGHCTSNDDGTQGCSWKSRTPFVVGGNLYLPVERQIPTGTTSVHDATLIMSPDNGLHWCNPYTYAHHSGSPGCDSGNWQAGGDAPPCGASAAGAGNPCTDTSYPGSILWPALGNSASQWVVVQYGQDGGTMPSTVTDGCDPSTYTCFFLGAQDSRIARVLNTDLPKLDVSLWQYYTCPGMTETYRCPGAQSGSWTSTLASGTQTLRAAIPLAGQYVIPNEIMGIVYVKEFKSYLATGYQNRGGAANAAPVFLWAPAIQGPWTLALSAPPVANTTIPTTAMYPGFISPSLALDYQVVSSNPPHVKITMAADTPAHVSATTPLFGQYDLILGKAPMWQGENYRYTNSKGWQQNASLVFSDSHRPGTIPLNGLVWAFDLFDHYGDTTLAAMSSWLDIGRGNAALFPCQGTVASPSACGEINAPHGVSFNAYGIETMESAFGGHYRSQKNGWTATDQNTPSAMQGNGTFSVINVFNWPSVGNHSLGPLWATGDAASSNTSVGLRLYNFFGIIAVNWWGSGADYWETRPSFTATAGNWYFVGITNQANGATPITKCWIGQSGAITDMCAGVTRVASGGSPTQTPNTSAGPITMGLGAGSTDAAGAQQSALMVYDRVLTPEEVQQIYATLKTKMTARGITLQ